MVYTNKVLSEKDQEDFNELWTISTYLDKIQYHDDIDFIVGEEELVIFDEADEYIYGSTQHFLDFVKTHRTICLTATCGGTQQDPSEKLILEHIGLKVFDSNMSNISSTIMGFE